MGVVVTAFRTEIDDCETTTDWSGGTLNSTFQLEGANCLGEKVSATTGAENMYTFPGANPDMTGNFIVIPMQVTGQPDTISNGGFRILVEDGNTDRGTWYVGGNDTTNEKWAYFIVDPSTAPTYLNGTLNSAKAVTSLVSSGTTATCTTTAVHGLATGDYVVISGASPGAYNGAWSITVSSTTVFTYTMASDPADTATGTIDLRQGVDFTDVDQVGVQFKTLSTSLGNSVNCLWDICWYGDGLQVTSTTDSVTLTRSGSTVTVASTAHGLVVGEKVRITGAVETDYNGDWEITAVGGVNDYDYDIGAATPATPATGTITARVHATWQHIADASAAGFWGLIVQTQGVNFMQGRFVFGSLAGADDLLFVDSNFKCIFRENLFLPQSKNNILPAKDLVGDEIDVEWSDGLISAFNTTWGYAQTLADFALDTLDCTGMTFESMGTFACEATSAHNYISCRWNDVLSLVPSTSTFTSCSYNNAPSASIGMTWPTSGNVTDMSFKNNPFSVLITQTTEQTFDAMVFDDLGTADILLLNGSNDIDVNNTNGSNANSYLGVPGGIVTFIADPATTKLTITDNQGVVLENARCFLETGDNGGGSGLPFEAAITSLTQASGTATLTATAVHGLSTNDFVVVRDATNEGYNRQAQITVTSTTVFTYVVPTGEPSPAGGTPTFSYAPISGLTNASGVIESTKSWPVTQSLTGWGRKSSADVKQSEINIADAKVGTDLLVALQPDT